MRWWHGPGCGLDTLPAGACIGTSSLRRAAFLRRWRPDLDVVDLRGNVPTRLRRLDDGDYDAIILAAAGLKRLGLADRITDLVPFDIMLPAVSQGAVAVQSRSDDDRVARWIEPLDHAPTRIRTIAERAVLREMEGGCQIPLGAHATIREGRLELTAAVASLDGSRSVVGNAASELGAAEALGRGLAADLLDRGAHEIMAGIRAAQDAGADHR
jgi:hydroxymethylbilane synthase